MENQHQNYMRMAIALAEKNVGENTGGPFGAVIVKDETIIAACSNSVTATNDPTAHAEINAIRLACKSLNSFSLKDCILYTSCEPCPMCFGAIYWAQISRVYYGCTKEDAADAGFNDDFIYKELDLNPDERKLRTNKLMQAEAQHAFDLWKKSEKRIDY